MGRAGKRPAEDRVKEIFSHGADAASNALQARKEQEAERKRVYAAELAAQMQERTHRKLQERAERLGAPHHAHAGAGPLPLGARQPPPVGLPAHNGAGEFARLGGGGDGGGGGGSPVAAGAAGGRFALDARDDCEDSGGQQACWASDPWSNGAGPGAAGGAAAYQQPPQGAHDPRGGAGAWGQLPSYQQAPWLGQGAAVGPMGGGAAPAHWGADAWGPAGGPQQQQQQRHALGIGGPDIGGGAFGQGQPVWGGGPLGGTLARPGFAHHYQQQAQQQLAAAAAYPQQQQHHLSPPQQQQHGFPSELPGQQQHSPMRAGGMPPPAAAVFGGSGGGMPASWYHPPADTSAAEQQAKKTQQQAKKDAYRLELEAQIRDRAERKAADKRRQQDDDRRKEAEIAARGDPWGKVGAGAPLRGEDGRVVSDLKALRGSVVGGGGGGCGGAAGVRASGTFGGQQAPGAGPPWQQAAQQQQQPGQPWGDPGPGAAWGGNQGAYAQQMQQQQAQHQQQPGGWGSAPMPIPGAGGYGGDQFAAGSPPGAGMPPPWASPGGGGPGGGGGGGSYGGSPPGRGAMMGPPHAQQPPRPPPGMRMGTAASAAGPAPEPLLNFRSDRAFMTAAEVERRARAQQELQSELARQIQEKQAQKEAQQRREQEAVAREEERLAREQARLAAQFEEERAKERQKAEKEDTAVKVVGAWEAAKVKAAEERRKTHDERRTRGAGGDAAGFGGDGSPPRDEGAGRELRHESSMVARQQAQGPGQQQQQQGAFGDAPTGPGVFVAPGQAWFRTAGGQQLVLAGPEWGPPPWQQAAGEGPQSAAAAEEIARLRQELRNEAAALRDTVGRQAAEMAGLRAMAAAADARSAAAASELGQVKMELATTKDGLQRETLSTILSDYAGTLRPHLRPAFHPPPLREVSLGLDLPPMASTLRRSQELEARSSWDGGGGGSGRGAEGPARSGGAGGGGGLAGARALSLPRDAESLARASGDRPLLAVESALIFPAGMQPPPEALSSGVGGPRAARVSQSMAQLWARPPRHTASAPGVLSESLAAAAAAAAGAPPGALSTVLPLDAGGRAAAAAAAASASAAAEGRSSSRALDLPGIAARNADKLRLLSSAEFGGAGGGAEALDTFLKRFVAEQEGQVAMPSSSELLTASGSGRPFSSSGGGGGGGGHPSGSTGSKRQSMRALARLGPEEAGLNGASAAGDAGMVAADSLDAELSRLGLLPPTSARRPSDAGSGGGGGGDGGGLLSTSVSSFACRLAQPPQQPPLGLGLDLGLGLGLGLDGEEGGGLPPLQAAGQGSEGLLGGGASSSLLVPPAF